MIYLDTTIVLAQLLAEDRLPPADLWNEFLVSSRLLEYEVWTRIHTMRLAKTHGEPVRQLISRIALLELASPVLARALEPFPCPVRTLDALHLASMEFLREHGQEILLATYDSRLLQCARSLNIPAYAC
jgi:hypothetical protein